MDPQQGELAKSLATTLASDYGQEDVDHLTKVILDADAKTFERSSRCWPSTALPRSPKWKPSSTRSLNPCGMILRWIPSGVHVGLAPTGHRKSSWIDRRTICVLPGQALDELLAVAEKLRDSGYRPTKIRPYASVETATSGTALVDHDVKSSAVWVRDGKNWQIQIGSSKEEFPTWDVPATKEGMVPEDAVAYRSSDGSTKFLVLWSESMPDDERRLVLDLKSREVDDRDESLGASMGTGLDDRAIGR